jgi:hypothetical protein
LAGRAGEEDEVGRGWRRFEQVEDLYAAVFRNNDP